MTLAIDSSKNITGMEGKGNSGHPYNEHNFNVLVDDN